MPLIYIMSWRSCHRFGQAFSETASWVVGYMIATGILLMLHFGGVGMISATPDDPLQIVAVVGGFIGMAASRYLWKRRGGHLEPAKNPFTDNRWFRGARAAVKASISGGKSAAAKRPQQSAPVTRQTSATSASTTAKKTSPRPASPARPSSADGKTSAQKWGRVVGAMLTPPDSRRRPPQ